MFWESVAASLTANVALVVITLAGGWLVLRIRRRSLLRFWGMEEVKQARVYLSHLRIQKRGAPDATGTPRSYQGGVVTQLEAEMGNVIKSLFIATVPGPEVQPSWAKALLFVTADVEVRPAPLQPQDIEQQGTVIALGSPGYNVVSGHIETACGSPVRFAQDKPAIQLPGDLTIKNLWQSVVVRIQSGDRYWFYAAGLSEHGTAAAAFYLAKNWRRLDRVYRKLPSFYVVIEFSGTDFRNTRVIAEAAI